MQTPDRGDLPVHEAFVKKALEFLEA